MVVIVKSQSRCSTKGVQGERQDADDADVVVGRPQGQDPFDVGFNLIVSPNFLFGNRQFSWDDLLIWCKI